jgi:D-alanyl-D-alanine endopeptidase (penicillin-binding protein 7)
LDSGASLDAPITITEADRDTLRHSRSRLRIGQATLSRREMLMVALMSSDNRAASALARTSPGGTTQFVAAMNRKAQALGMHDTSFVDSSGLDNRNRSTAEDLVKMVRGAARYPLIREATSLGEMKVHPFADAGALEYRNTNPLVRNPEWHVEVSKTGFINEAGHCLVMQTKIGGRRLYVVFLDAVGKLTPVGDSNRLRTWLDGGQRIAGN